MSIPREQPNQNKGMKIADLVLLSLYMRDNKKCNISHAPYSILNTKCIGVIKTYLIPVKSSSAYRTMFVSFTR